MSARKSASNPHVAVSYIRTSTDRQDLSPAAQRAAVAAWAKRTGVAVAAEHVEVVSGGAPLEDRPQLLAAIESLREHGAGVLVVAKRDRLGRDPIVSAMAERAAARHGARVVSAAGEGDGDDPVSVLTRRMVDAFAEFERLIIGARTKAALGAKRARGERVGGVPLGQRLGADGVHLEVDPTEAAIVERVRFLRSCGESLRAICARLDREGYRPRSGGHWHPPQVARMCAGLDGERSAA
jgi:DNA invertase Pin-like site-specific DNA recombinase